MQNTEALKKDKVHQHIRKLINEGKLAEGSKLPREIELAVSLNISRNTLRSALKRLEEEGILKRVQGSGTFVASAGRPLDGETVMIIHPALSGFESPWHYIVPEISRLAGQLHLKTFITSDQALAMFSEASIIPFVKKNNIIGIITTIHHLNGDEPHIQKLKAAGVPIVIAHANFTDTEVSGFGSVVIDETKGWKAAIAHLAKKKFSPIAVLGYKGAKKPFRGTNAKETFQLLQEYGIESEFEMVHEVNFDQNEIKNYVKSLMNKTATPEAILCSSDFIAVYVYEALEEMGLKVPDDIVVMGTCGYPDAEFLSPPLSTVDYEYAKIAEMSLEMILDQKKWFDPISGKGKIRVKPYKIKARKSTNSYSK